MSPYILIAVLLSCAVLCALATSRTAGTESWRVGRGGGSLMRSLAFAAVCGMLVGSVLALSITFAFNIRNSTTAFIIRRGVRSSWQLRRHIRHGA